MKNIVLNSKIEDVFEFYRFIKTVRKDTALLESLGNVYPETSRYSTVGVLAEEELWEEDGKFYLRDLERNEQKGDEQKGDEQKRDKQEGDGRKEVRDWLGILDSWCGNIGANRDVFQTGAMGYIGYEMNREFEKIPDTGNVRCPVSKVRMVRYSLVLLRDRVMEKSYWIADDEEAADTAGMLEEQFMGWAAAGEQEAHGCADGRPEETGADSGAAWGAENRGFRMLGDIEPDFTREGYIDSIEKCIRYIRRGDMLQSNITMRFHGDYIGDPFAVYEKMREATPNPYFAYFDFREKLISTSPESFLRTDRGVIQSRPIKGTVRCVIDGEDQADFLRNSVKNRAENTMIADLIRNDIGRVCEIGTVRVPALCEIKRYNNLYHLETVVEGDLKKNLKLSDVLRGNFPGGSITGAPKVRSMEVIDELEFTERGPYCGMIGFFGNGGYLNTSIGIRIVYFDEKHFYLHTGGGIVAKSEPWDEYDELLLKVEKMMGAINEFHVLKPLRKEIDECNLRLLRTLAKRMDCVRTVKKTKERYGIPVDQPARIQSIIGAMKRINKLENMGLDDTFIEEIFTRIIDEAVRVEKAG